MNCYHGTNNRATWWTFTDPCKPEVRPGTREESASPAWLAAPAMNARDTTKVYVWRLDTGCGPTIYRKCHSHNTPGKSHYNTWVEPLRGTVLYRIMRYKWNHQVTIRVKLIAACVLELVRRTSNLHFLYECRCVFILDSFTKLCIAYQTKTDFIQYC